MYSQLVFQEGDWFYVSEINIHINAITKVKDFIK